jgi:hypothetical protein
MYSFSQSLNTKTYYPKDSLEYTKTNDWDYHLTDYLDKEKFGKTTMIIKAETKSGHFHFVFKKKIHELTRTINYNGKAVGEYFDFKTNQWKHQPETWTYNDVKGQIPIDTTVYSTHDLYAFVFVEDHGGLLEKARFQDFGNVVYWPAFDYPNCSVSDEDQNNSPEFYLTYMGHSDGLDAKEYKQIIYSFPKNSHTLSKSKITAFYPAGNEDDVYKEVPDTNWKVLPKKIQTKSKQILGNYKKQNGEAY